MSCTRAYAPHTVSHAMSYHFTQFFSLGSPKAIKARSFGYMNAINYMAPASTAGVGDMCPWSSVACRALCLGEHSGQAAIHKEGETNAVLESRKAKTVMFMRARATFMRELAAGIGRAERKAKREGLATSAYVSTAQRDSTGLRYQGLSPHQFVDYTKSEARALAHAQGKLAPTTTSRFIRGRQPRSMPCSAGRRRQCGRVFQEDIPPTWLDTSDRWRPTDLRHLDARATPASSRVSSHAKSALGPTRGGVELGFAVTAPPVRCRRTALAATRLIPRARKGDLSRMFGPWFGCGPRQAARAPIPASGWFPVCLRGFGLRGCHRLPDLIQMKITYPSPPENGVGRKSISRIVGNAPQARG